LKQLRRLLVLIGLATAIAPTAVAEAARPLELGFTDKAFQAPDASTRGLWLNRATESRSDAGSALAADRPRHAAPRL
jgi:hypothetical protein